PKRAKTFPKAHERNPTPVVLDAYPVQILPVEMHNLQCFQQGESGIVNMSLFRSASIQFHDLNPAVGQVIQGSGPQVETPEIEFGDLPADAVKSFVQSGRNKVVAIK